MRIVVALGGNALLKRGEPMTAEVQRANVRRAAASLAELVRAGHQIVVTHGNGPQVGLIALQSAAGPKDGAYPLDILGAAARVTVPWLIVHGAEDETVSHQEAEALRAASPLAATRLLSVEGAGHTFGAGHPWNPQVHDTPALHRVFDMTLAWFAAHLG